MGIYSKKRYEIRHKVAYLCQDMLWGTVASPGSGTFVCDAAEWEKSDDFFNKWIEVFCFYGTGEGTSGNPTDWDKATHTLTFAPAATLTAGDLVEMHQRFAVDEYNAYINMAIDLVAKEALVNLVDTSITMEEETWSYDLPVDFLYVYRVDMESDTANVYPDELGINPKYWRIVKSATTRLEFIQKLDNGDYYYPTDGRKLRISGLASPSALTTDTQESPINPTWLAYQAAALIHQSRIRGSSADSENHSAQFKLCQAMADKERDSIRTRLPQGSRAVIEV